MDVGLVLILVVGNGGADAAGLLRADPAVRPADGQARLAGRTLRHGSHPAVLRALADLAGDLASASSTPRRSTMNRRHGAGRPRPIRATALAITPAAPLPASTPAAHAGDVQRCRRSARRRPARAAVLLPRSVSAGHVRPVARSRSASYIDALTICMFCMVTLIATLHPLLRDRLHAR